MATGEPAGRRHLLILPAVLIAASLLSAIRAAFPQNTWLQVGPVIVFAITLPFFAARLRLSGTAWNCVGAFLLVHLFAAHWTYSDVPYAKRLTQVGIDTASLGTRNMFDRFVHFSFGALAVRPMVELEQRTGMSLRTAIRVSILFVLAASALYEIFEWSLAIFMSPEAADAYNGQQGDIFDAQKDMLMAFIGALVAWPLVRSLRD